jgi:hypothetical protein
MNRIEVRKVLQESFLGAFPESALRKLEDGARVTTLSARQLLYDPEISIIGEGRIEMNRSLSSGTIVVQGQSASDCPGGRELAGWSGQCRSSDPSR